MLIRKAALLACLLSGLFTLAPAEAGLFGRRSCRQAAPVVCSYSAVPHVTPCRPSPHYSSQSSLSQTANQFDLIQIPIIVEKKIDGKTYKETRVVNGIVPRGASAEVREAFIRLQTLVQQNSGKNIIQDDRLTDLESP